jgi:hypothetical protein
LLKGRENASVLDLKMGTTSITVNTPQSEIEAVNKKDETTTTRALGFRVTGYVIKDDKGQVAEKVTKPHGKA